MGGGSGTCHTCFGCISAEKNHVISQYIYIYVKNIPWGHKGPPVVTGGVVGSSRGMGGGSGTCRTPFGCILA